VPDTCNPEIKDMKWHLADLLVMCDTTISRKTFKRSFTYSVALRIPAPAANGQSGSAAATMAASSSKWGRGLKPVEAASAAATPKIRTGVTSGKTSSGNSTLPRRAPSTTAAHAVPSSDSSMVPGNSPASSQEIAELGIRSMIAKGAAVISNGIPVTSQ
jgi:hypothetical protein